MQTNEATVIRVFAAPMQGCDGGGNPWAEAARGLEQRFRTRYGERLRVEFVELFSPEFFAHGEIMGLIRDGDAAPPVVTVNDRVVQTGGKLSDRIIKDELDRVGIRRASDAQGKEE